ncbi:MAG: formylglycine-generating enzyme family protein [Rhodopirellula sp.]|nr:formylglycine-generating enzyme family protein [Rhodopirellula sp.]
MPRPEWASAIGRDEFGLWADLKVEGKASKDEGSSDPEGTISKLVVRLRWIPPGRFTMGSPKDEPGRSDEREFEPHPVVIPEGFWLFETPVTQHLWEAVLGPEANASEFRSAERPVERVSWKDCRKFCSKLTELTERTGLEVSLPSEAEWEYACRAGTTEATYAGIFQNDQITEPVLDSIAWYWGNRDSQSDLGGKNGTHPVAQKFPNPWGLYDMLGNVYEWCSDVGLKPGDSVPDDVDEASASRVIRGGGWDSSAQRVRAAYRLWLSPVHRDLSLGFRCRVREFKPSEESSDSVSAERRSP